MTTATTGANRLSSCLARMQGLLEKGAVGEAAAMVSELNGIVSGEPEPMTDSELAEAHVLLSRCGELERELRHSVLEALQRLGATRRSRAYRQP